MNSLLTEHKNQGKSSILDPTKSWWDDESPLGLTLTRKLRQLCRDHCEAEGGCHGPDHTERVHRTALHLGRLMGAKLDVLSASALLHDIGRSEETAVQGQTCHAARGAQLAKPILLELGFFPAMIEEILHCIVTHRFRGEAIPLSLEAKILFDADKLDSIGAIGIGRAFLFAGQVGARLHNGHLDMSQTEAYSLEDTAYREFQEKLRAVKDRMLTPVGLELATERHQFMQLFFKRLDKEIGATRTHTGPIPKTAVALRV